MSKILKSYCTVTWAENMLSDFAFNDAWKEATEEKKLSALNAATEFIDMYCTFFNNEANETHYEKSDKFLAEDPDDYANAINPESIKKGCAYEANYLLSLDENPAEPLPITVLGLIKMESFTVDKDLVPPVFPNNVIRILENMGAVIERSASGQENSWLFRKETT